MDSTRNRKTIIGASYSPGQVNGQPKAVARVSNLSTDGSETDIQTVLVETSRRQLQLLAENQRLIQQLQELQEKNRVLVEQNSAALARLNEQREFYEDLEVAFAERIAAQQAVIKMHEEGIGVELHTEILFAPEAVQPTAEGRHALSRLSAELKESLLQIVVAGYTDHLPISGRAARHYPSNWELAAARAANVVRLFEQDGIRPDRLIAVSHGSTRPVASNDTEAGRARNRRVEICLRPVLVEPDEPPV